ncbi:ATP-binding protein [Chitinophaga sancti]|uniref:AAA family ATPase n=1 Tax=Chitinophaga sancti TaxID=1004 RepID=A0A1K1NGD1_9BACT|nr:ATP-binding protein [Chitinophaga sancti]WQD63239.1 AAA family ATPase [Chitinophaga sancti]WQG91135.1 AAA family ATPase [Chitinophaga sancti]SFW34496.1 PD-(D/E)XK nuclease superfamily protein [Chitinophaga sancti]
MRKYPIGLQDFGNLRKEGFLYIDKTRLIYNLIDLGKYYFLSRPRRFGKSLLLSTIKEIFNGKKELFEGLWIYDQWNWEQRHPVIHLRFSQIDYKGLGLTAAISRELDFLAAEFGIQLREEDSLALKFRELIREVAKIGHVVILIDEYDKPITDYLEDIEMVEENRSVFKNFYSVLKDADEYIRLLLITGVSRFTKVSIFSDLNNLYDISLNPHYAALTGVTQEEMETSFAKEIVLLQQKQPDILGKLKEWYNGYSWDGTTRVYNPFSLLSYMGSGRIQNFWYQTGTPTWLVNLMKKQKVFDLENIHMGENALSNFNIEHLSPVPVLFQTGYLTIKNYNEETRLFELGYPNREVEESLTDALLSAYRNVFPGNDSMELTFDLANAMKNNDMSQMVKVLDVLLSTIPYDHRKAESESIFHIIVHLSFKRLGMDVRSEVHSASGRCDVLVFTKKYIYALELKLNGTAQAALNQIINKGYLHSYQLDPRKKIAIGINFSSGKRAVEEFLVEEFA